MNDYFGITNRKLLAQLHRYALVGIASNLVGYVVYLLITYFGIEPKLAMSLLYLVGTSVGFWGNGKLTFAHSGSHFSAGFRYVIVYCLGYFVNLSILIVMVDRLGYAHQWVQAIAIFVVATFLFLALKFFVFRESPLSSTREL